MKYILLLYAIFATMFVNGQNAFSDAMNISELHPGTLNNKVIIPNNEDVFKILRNYTSDSVSTPAQIQLAFKNNPFISVPTPQGGSGIDKSVILNSIGGLDVTNIADGFAKFLVKRTKEELNVAFFSRFYDQIKKEEYKDARILFPQTYATLSVIGNEIYAFQLYINTLRESFEKDLNGLLDNLPTVINDVRYKAFF